MATGDKWRSAAVNAAKKAKAAADRLLKALRTKAETAARRRKLKQRLETTGRVLRAAGKAAVVAAVAAGVAAGRAELRRKKKKP